MIEQNKNVAEKKGQQLMALNILMNEVREVIWDSNNYVAIKNRFYYTVFMKLSFLLDAIHTQVYNLDHKPHYCLATGLTIRTSMLDVLNLYYVMDVDQEPQIAERRINSIMSDHLKYSYNDLSQNEKVQCMELWPELFDETGILIKHKSLRTKDLASEISNLATLRNESKEAFHVYNIFSKYEHNGAFTFNLVHNPYIENTNDVIKFMIYGGIGISALACKFIAANWIPLADPLTAKLDNIVNELRDIESPRSLPS